MQKRPFSTLLILAPLAFLLHNLEESLTMVSFVQINLQRMPTPIRLLAEHLQLKQAFYSNPSRSPCLIISRAKHVFTLPRPWGQEKIHLAGGNALPPHLCQFK